jgi:hypothetical protein
MAISRVTPGGWLQETDTQSRVTPFGWVQESAVAAITYAFARPDADVTDGAWTPSSGGDLYAMLDEVTYDDGDYIYTMTPSECAVSLSALGDPGVSTNHTVRYRAAGDGATDLIVTLKQGSTTIATWTESNASSTATTYEHTLTTGEADSITDYTDLKLHFEAA